MNDVDILIISDKLDFTTDYVCLELAQRGDSYLRVNRDEFAEYSITLEINPIVLKLERAGLEFQISDPHLKSIYFRAPVYLRDIYQPGLPMHSQLYRTQWSAFIRDLSIFENPLWINNPVMTYKAENKLLQLKYAQMEGFTCPRTIVTNASPRDIVDDADYIVKSIDTAVLRIGDDEAFVYSNKVTGLDLKHAMLSTAPVIIQDYIYPKMDLRVTVVGNTVFTVKIISNHSGVDGDWRQMKDKVEYIEYSLPEKVSKSCVNLTKSLGLYFGAIDLIESNGKIYFLEINPTGEWGWLINAAQLPIHKAICDALECRNG